MASATPCTRPHTVWTCTQLGSDSAREAVRESPSRDDTATILRRWGCPSAVPNRESHGHSRWPLCVPIPLTCDNVLNSLSVVMADEGARLLRLVSDGYKTSPETAGPKTQLIRRTVKAKTDGSPSAAQTPDVGLRLKTRLCHDRGRICSQERGAMAAVHADAG